MKRDPKPPLNFRFHGELDVKQLIDICIEVQRPKADKAIEDEFARAEKTSKCQKICINELNDRPKICINELNDCPKICIGGLRTENMPKYKVSIVGDSISTYVGFNPYGYPVYYKDDRAYDNEINSVDDTWWKQVIDGLGGELCVNNSYSGSMVVGAVESSACSNERCSNLHDETAPDIILIYIGTNDRGFEMNLGENRPEDTMGFYGAYRTMLKRIKKNYPTAKIVCGTLLMGRLQAGHNLAYDRFMKEDTRYNGAIRLAVKEEGCLLADIALSDERYETLDYCHPTKNGHKEMAKLWLAELKNLLTEGN